MHEDSHSTTSNVSIWLDHQPDQPEDYVLEQPKNSKRKRKTHPIGQTLSTHSPERQQLKEISSDNVIAEPVEQRPERRRRSSKQGPPPATPTRQGRTKKTAPQPDPVSNHLGCIEEADLDQILTPRPNPRKIPSFPQSFQSRPANPQFKPPLSHGASSDGGESRDSNEAGSQSPNKTLGDLQFSDMPIDSQTWSSGTIPTEMKELARDMHIIGRGAGVIPMALKDKFVETEEIILDFQWAIESGQQRGKELKKSSTENITGGLGHDQFWHRVLMIYEATDECLKEHDSEPAWNSEVHSTVLRLALTGHWAANEVWYKDITVARISNKSLVPWNISTGALQSKMVDYAILINPSQKFAGDPSKFLHNHIIEKLRVEKAGASINQTASDWVRFKPIAVSVETKRGAVGEDETHVRLATWLTAQYSRLRQLMLDTTKDKTKLPSFPVLSVQGPRWLLMIASLVENDRINLIKELDLGRTDSIAGVYQVVAAIRRIAQWVNDDYRPWFEKEILGIKAGVLSRP